MSALIPITHLAHSPPPSLYQLSVQILLDSLFLTLQSNYSASLANSTSKRSIFSLSVSLYLHCHLPWSKPASCYTTFLVHHLSVCSHGSLMLYQYKYQVISICLILSNLILSLTKQKAKKIILKCRTDWVIFLLKLLNG